mmetsp:Transcript_5783/g.4967  ORF Transcript_5783/g.4967 Transcript_5783/m.4967 type:complete len:121 (+) Transcript_5783:21-383(+)
MFQSIINNFKFDDNLEKACFSKCHLKFRIKNDDHAVLCQNFYTAFEVKSLNPTQKDFENVALYESESKLKTFERLRELAEDDSQCSLINDPNIYCIPEPSYFIIENPCVSTSISIHSSIP